MTRLNNDFNAVYGVLRKVLVTYKSKIFFNLEHKMTGNILIGATFLFTGIKLIFSKGLKRFILVPLIINFIIFVTIIIFSANKLLNLFNDLTQEFPLWTIYFLSWLLWIIFSITTVIIMATLFVFITNFIAAPFYGLLAEKTELKISNEKNLCSFSIKEILFLIPRTLFREIRKFLYFLPWLILVLIIFIFPLTLPIAPIIWFLVMSWIIAIQYIDYTPDNQKKSFKNVISALKKEPLTVLGFGGMISLLINLPGFNLLIPPAAVVGGCKLWVYLQANKQNIH